MDLNFVTDILITILILPLQLVLVPLDALLAQIPGIGIVPSSFAGLTSFVGSLPSTMVNLVGLNPILWNMFFLTFVLYITASPTVSLVKKIWAWVRP